MKLLPLICLLCLATATARTADLASFVELPEGFIIGGHSKTGWLNSEAAGKSLKTGVRYRLFGLSGEAGTITADKAMPDPDVCPDVWMHEITPETDKPLIGVSAPWEPAPRKAKQTDTSQPVYIKAAADFLAAQGIARPVVKITQILRVDLEGDGEDEVLLSATHYPDKQGGMVTSASAGNYSFVLLRRVVGGKLHTSLVEGEFYPTPKEFNAPNRYEVTGLLDLDGDGKLEIIVHSKYYEGAATSVWQLGKRGLKRVLEIGCGA
ncbi:MAG: hypothetical protein K1X78_24285 [Verrucomicrobiaceae bacterium]|nr:hypothetical protein [Verrucomicrobiaceae bacterium]